jgi:hypothetical protein
LTVQTRLIGRAAKVAQEVREEWPGKVVQKPRVTGGQRPLGKVDRRSLVMVDR